MLCISFLYFGSMMVSTTASQKGPGFNPHFGTFSTYLHEFYLGTLISSYNSYNPKTSSGLRCRRDLWSHSNNYFISLLKIKKLKSLWLKTAESCPEHPPAQTQTQGVITTVLFFRRQAELRSQMAADHTNNLYFDYLKLIKVFKVWHYLTF